MGHFASFIMYRAADTNGIGLVIGAGVLIVVFLIVIAKSLRGAPSEPAKLSFATAVEPAIESDGEISDAEFEKRVQGLVDKTGCKEHIYTTVAGSSYPNPDGTSRARIIARCEVYETIELRPEPENPFGHGDAMAFHRLGTGEQLGYLKKELSQEIADDFRKYGPCWLGMFRRHNHHPDTGAVVGAVIFLMHLPVEELVEDEVTEKVAV